MYLVFIEETKACFFAESSCFYIVNFGKVNYFSIFGGVRKNKLKNIFLCLVMS